MAQQLHARGEQVSALALLDSYALGHSELIPLTERCRHEMDVLARRVKMHWKNILRSPAKERLRYVRHKGRTLRRKIKSQLWQMLYQCYARSGRPLPTALQNVKEANFLAAKDYVTKPYAGSVTLFLASEQTVEGDPCEVWGKLALGGVTVHQIPGDHVTLIEEPNVRVLAEHLASCLKQ
jgi:aspartate racemase